MAPSTELVSLGRSDIPDTWTDRRALARELADAGMLPTQYVGKPGNILAAQMASNALDIPLWVTFQELNFISGKTGLSAFLMRALITRAGHEFELVEDDAVHAKFKLKRKEWPIAKYVEYRIEDARIAGLIKPGGNYDKNPGAMMVARATTKGAKLYFADVLAGFGQSAEELEDERQAQTSGGRIEKPVDAPAPATPEPAEKDATEPAAEPKQEPLDADVVPDPQQDSRNGDNPAQEKAAAPETTPESAQLPDPTNLEEFIDQVVLARDLQQDDELQRLWKLGRESTEEWLGYDYEGTPLRKWILDARKSVSAAKAGK